MRQIKLLNNELIIRPLIVWKNSQMASQDFNASVSQIESGMLLISISGSVNGRSINCLNPIRNTLKNVALTSAEPCKIILDLRELSLLPNKLNSLLLQELGHLLNESKTLNSVISGSWRRKVALRTYYQFNPGQNTGFFGSLPKAIESLKEFFAPLKNEENPQLDNDDEKQSSDKPQKENENVELQKKIQALTTFLNQDLGTPVEDHPICRTFSLMI